MSKKKKVTPKVPQLFDLNLVKAIESLPPVPLKETEIEYSDGTKITVMLPDPKVSAAQDKKLKKILQPFMDQLLTEFNFDKEPKNEQ